MSDVPPLPAVALVPLSVPAGTHLPAIVGKVTGGTYVSLYIEQRGTTYECPVMLGSLLVHDEYKPAWDAFVTARLHVDDHIEVTVTGGQYRLRDTHLPIVEVLDVDGRPLALHAIREGWALPNEYALSDNVYRTDYIAATMSARMSKAGIWGDQALSGTIPQAMSASLLSATNPGRTDFLVQWKGPMFVVLIVVVVFIGWQQWHLKFDPVEAAKRDQRNQRDQERGWFEYGAVKTSRGLWGGLVIAPFRMLPKFGFLFRRSTGRDEPSPVPEKSVEKS
jgi:hypothetical protein